MVGKENTEMVQGALKLLEPQGEGAQEEALRELRKKLLSLSLQAGS